MLNENARKWVAALRSGKYRQIGGILTRIDPTTKATIGHCCLGVACEIAIENGVDLAVEIVGDHKIYNGKEAFLPYIVSKWLGLNVGGDGQFEAPDPIYRASTLASMNDRGAPFELIAATIESEPSGLFVSSGETHAK
jgi:hypothetical protein